MKSGRSSLNPYAESYVPLSKRAVGDKYNVTALKPGVFKSGNDISYSGHPEHFSQKQHQGIRDFPLSEGFTQKGNSAHYGSSSQSQNEFVERQISNDDFEMDLAYLQLTFPGVSDQSLTDVYLANNFDLEATIDMLSQLESYTVESSENLPDTLDIGDVPEPASSKLKKGEASSSSMGPSNPATVT